MADDAAVGGAASIAPAGKYADMCTTRLLIHGSTRDHPLDKPPTHEEAVDLILREFHSNGADHAGVWQSGITRLDSRFFLTRLWLTGGLAELCRDLERAYAIDPETPSWHFRLTHAPSTDTRVYPVFALIGMPRNTARVDGVSVTERSRRSMAHCRRKLKGRELLGGDQTMAELLGPV